MDLVLSNCCTSVNVLINHQDINKFINYWHFGGNISNLFMSAVQTNKKH